MFAGKEMLIFLPTLPSININTRKGKHFLKLQLVADDYKGLA